MNRSSQKVAAPVPWDLIPEKSSTSDSITGEEELKSQSSFKEFDDIHVGEDAPGRGNKPKCRQHCSTSKVVVSDRYDIGRAVRKTKRGEQLTDNERETYLSQRWVPKRKDEYPYSERKKPKKQLTSGNSLTTKPLSGRKSLENFPLASC